MTLANDGSCIVRWQEKGRAKRYDTVFLVERFEVKGVMTTFVEQRWFYEGETRGCRYTYVPKDGTLMDFSTKFVRQPAKK